MDKLEVQIADCLRQNRNLTKKGADKGGNIVIMDTPDYIENCELLLNERERERERERESV